MEIAAVFLSLIALLAIVRVARPGSAPAVGAAPQAGPDLGFDYRKMIDDHLRAIAEGKPDVAVDVLVKHAPLNFFAPPALEDLKRRFAAAYAGGGKYEDVELIGFRQLSSKTFKLYAAAHFEHRSVLFGYAVRRVGAEWKL